MKRIFLFSLIFCLVVAGFCFTASADEEPTVSFDFKSAALTITDSVYISLKAEASGVEFSDIKLLVWDAPMEEYLVGTETYKVNFSGEIDSSSGKDRGVYKFKGMSAKMLADDFYFVLYSNVNGVDCYSRLVKYSALQYAYNKLGITGTKDSDPELIALLQSLVRYGASVQKYLEWNEERVPSLTDFHQVTVKSGMLADGTAKGLYHINDKVSLVAGEAPLGLAFSHWEDSLGNLVSTEANATIDAPDSPEVYTAIFLDPRKFTMTLDDSDITGVFETSTIRYGDSFALPTLESDGYKFLGWYVDGVKVTDSVWNYEENKTFVAKWEIIVDDGGVLLPEDNWS